MPVLRRHCYGRLGSFASNVDAANSRSMSALPRKADKSRVWPLCGFISDIAESDFGCTVTRFIPPCILCLCEVLHRRTRLSVASSKARQRLGIWLSEGPQWTDKHSHQESSSITTTERSAKHVGSRGRRYLFTPTTLATARSCRRLATVSNF